MEPINQVANNPLRSMADYTSDLNKLDLQRSTNALQGAHARFYNAEAADKEFKAQQEQQALSFAKQALQANPKMHILDLAGMLRNEGHLAQAGEIEKRYADAEKEKAQAAKYAEDSKSEAQKRALATINHAANILRGGKSYQEGMAMIDAIPSTVMDVEAKKAYKETLLADMNAGLSWDASQAKRLPVLVDKEKELTLQQSAEHNTLARDQLRLTEKHYADQASHQATQDELARQRLGVEKAARADALSAPTEVTDLTTGQPVLVQRDKSGKLIPVSGYGPKDPAAKIGAREAVFADRIIRGANQSAKDLENIISLPIEASTGVFGGRQQGPGLLSATKEVLANKMTQQDAQSYNVMATGFQRNLAAIESAGLMPSGSLTKQMESILWKEGDTNLTKLQKLAQIAQIVEAGMETTATNPRLPQETKDHAADIVKSIRKAVPFTQQDLIKLQAQQQINPNTTLADVLKMQKASTEAYSDAEKERRYQEWKAKQK